MWLGDVGLGFDEPQHIYAARAWLASGDPVLPSGMVYDRALPYTQLVAVSLHLFGDTIFAARLPSALFGTASLFVTFLLGRLLFGGGTALLATFLLALLPFEIVWARTARMYATYQFFYLLAVYAFYAGFEEPAGASDAITRRITRWRWGERLTLGGQLGVAWLILSLISLVCASMLHDLAGLIGLSMLVYASGHVLVASSIAGVREALKSKYALLAGGAALTAGVGLLLPGVLDGIRSNLTFRPSWVGEAQRQNSYYLNFLNSGAQFPLGVFVLLGTLQGLARAHRGALFAAVFAGTPLLFHSLIPRTQSARYLYDCFPLLVLLSTYAGVNLFTTERRRIERSTSPALASERRRALAVIGLAVLMLIGLVFVQPGIRNGTRRALRQGVSFGGEFNVDWAGACRYVREQAAEGDVLITSIPLAAAAAGCPPISYNLDNGELDQFTQWEARLPRHAFADVPAIIDLEGLRFALGQGERFWLLADAERIGNDGNTPPNVREAVLQTFRLRWTSPDDTISVYEWRRADAGAQTE
jgi:4-amino-4-deoxy-L-arabinose transferase-like glycosyltransferase